VGALALVLLRAGALLAFNPPADEAALEGGGKLVLKMTRTATMTADVSHWQYDTFKAVFRDPTVPDAYLSFSLGPDGRITELRMVPTNDLADFSFDYQDLLFKPTGK